MAIGERIHFLRNLRGMTQKYLGVMVGFPEKSADVRMAQYETGSRTPKAEITTELARVLEVSPNALTIPDIDTNIGLMHTLFALEDIYGLSVSESNGEICLKLNASKNGNSQELYRMLAAWKEQADMLNDGEIDKERYDDWRYNYPALEKAGEWGKVPSEEFSDAMVEAFKDQLAKD